MMLLVISSFLVVRIKISEKYSYGAMSVLCDLVVALQELLTPNVDMFKSSLSEHASRNLELGDFEIPNFTIKRLFDTK